MSDIKKFENSLPDSFQFSQSSLQDFVDCRRRFQLRYILALAWPALQSEPALESERSLQRGAQFHHIVRQHSSGVPAERLAPLVGDPDLQRWWENYLAFAPKIYASASPLSFHPEISLSAPLGERRLVAKYDLVVASTEGRFIIVDWKTSRRRPRRQPLAERLQTRVYPYLLVRAGAHLNQGNPIRPQMVEMVYWFAEFPEQAERYAYSERRFQEDEAYLTSLIEQISRLGPEDYPLTQDERRCAYCAYRSLCDRGVKAGSLDDIDLQIEADQPGGVYLDFEQIAEIEF